MRDHVDALLAAYCDGALAEDERRRVEAHVASCPRCAGLLERVAEARAAALGMGPVALPEETAARIRSAIARGPDPGAPATASAPSPASPGRGALRARRIPRRWPLRWAWAAVPAAAAVVIAALWLAVPSRLRVEPAPGALGAIEVLAAEALERLSAAPEAVELRSGSPAAVRGWLEERGLAAALAVDRPPEEGGRVRLLGAEDLSRPGFPAAAVLYEVGGSPVVLVAARQREVPDVPRWTPFAKTVQHREADRLTLLTWSNSGKAYTLAARDSRLAQEGCRFCHADGGRQRTLARELGTPPRPGG